ncbi:MAG: hypothetical protein IH851_05165 [Armatimonadetes bacterium]|nr:hypothetical protein [Armatimonadota bacterium]
MPSQFPLADAELRAWLDNFIANEGVFGPLALPLTFFDELNTRGATFGTDFDAHLDTQTAAESGTTTKNTSRTTVIEELRGRVRELRSNPLTTGAMLLAVGLPEHDTTPSPILPPTTAPTIEMEAFGAQAVRIFFWDPDNPAPGRKGKPEGARSCRLIGAVLAQGAPAPPVDDMQFVADDTSTPNDQSFDPADVGKVFWVRGAWATPTSELGPWSAPVSITVPG